MVYIVHVIPVVCTKTNSQINSENQKYSIVLTFVGIDIDIDIDIDCVEKINIYLFVRSDLDDILHVFIFVTYWPNVEHLSKWVNIVA